MKTLKHIVILLSIILTVVFIPYAWLVLLALVVVKKAPVSKPNYQPEEPTPIDSYTPPIFVDIPTKQAYLKSPEWNTIRKSILARDEYTCQSCGTESVPLEVHHLTYERLYSELDSHLTSLCRSCHQLQHDHYGYDYNTKFYPIIKG